jgi:hypothetical protein
MERDWLVAGEASAEVKDVNLVWGQIDEGRAVGAVHAVLGEEGAADGLDLVTKALQ